MSWLQRKTHLTAWSRGPKAGGTRQTKEKQASANSFESSKANYSPVSTISNATFPERHRRLFDRIPWKKNSITSISSSSLTSIDSNSGRMLNVDEDPEITKIEDILCEREERDSLVEFLLSVHSPIVRLIRFFTAVNEVLSTDDGKEFSRKAGKIVAAFVSQNARYFVELPIDLQKGLGRKRKNAFVLVRRHILSMLAADDQVQNFVATTSF